MGRQNKAKPSAIVKMQRGNVYRPKGHKTVDPNQEPDPDYAAPARPEWLRERHAVDMWNRLAPLLARRGCLGQYDAESFALACRCYHGLVTSFGKPSLFKAFSTEFRQYIDLFGLSPSSRTAISVDEKFRKTTQARERKKSG